MIILVLRRVPEVVELDKKELETESTEMLSQKGVPVMVFSRVRVFVIFWVKRIWQFLLEVKDMGHGKTNHTNIKRRNKTQSTLHGMANLRLLKNGQMN
jgi:hypothetical protein